MSERQYIIIVGAGKVGWNLARELLEKGNEVTLIENNRERYLTVEQEVPEYGLVHLLDLPEQRLEIIEMELPNDSRAAGSRVGDLQMPEGSLLISVLREGTGFVPNSDTVLQAGDEILAVLDPRVEEDLTSYFGPDGQPV